MEVEKVMVRVIKAPVVTKDNLGGRVRKNSEEPKSSGCNLMPRGVPHLSQVCPRPVIAFHSTLHLPLLFYYLSTPPVLSSRLTGG